MTVTQAPPADQEFNDSEIWRIPKEWKVVRLREILTLLRNGLTTEQNKEGIGYPVTRIETISDEKIDTNKLGYLSDVTEKEVKDYRLDDGDVLFSHINSLEHIGKTAIYSGSPKVLLHGMNLLLLRPDKEKVDPIFLLSILRFFRMRKIFANMSKKAVNQASINQMELGKLKIPLPPLPEQRRIAEILSAVDQAIQLVDEAIARTERLKRGLMQQLLTRGIGHHEFKDTDIGRIPRRWEVVRLGDKKISEEFFYGLTAKAVDKDTGLKMLRTTDIKEYSVDWEKLPFCEITERRNNLAKYLLKGGDLIVARAGTVGVSILVDRDFDNTIFGSYLIKVKLKPIIDPKFVHYFFQSSIYWKHLQKAQGSTLKNINLPLLKSLKTPLPPLLEQRRIAEILSTVDKKLELERRRKEKLERIKRGLMNDLLTGKVRVKVYRTSKDIQDILPKIKEKLKEIYGERLKHVLLYGSFADDRATEDSDIDIAVVLEGKVDTTREIDRIYEELYDLELESGELISVYPISEEEFEDEVWPLHHHIRRGIEI